MKNTAILATIISLLAFAFSSCKKENNANSNDQYNRGVMLGRYADSFIVPAYAVMEQQLTTLSQRAGAFTTAPGAGALQDLRQAWMESYQTWQRTELLEFGPAEEVSLRMYMNIYPVSVTKVNDNISTGSYNLDAFGNTDAQGFPALDYLLNGTGADATAVVSWFTDNAQGAARRKYLNDVVTKMLTKVQGVHSAWTSYRSTFAGQTGTDVNSSLSQMTNAFVLYYERYLRSGKIGLPVGAMSGVARPELVEARFAPALSKDLALRALKAVTDFYEGISYHGATDGPGMKDYLAAIGTTGDNGKPMADLISEALAKASASLQGLNSDISEAVVNQRPAVLNVYDDLQALVPLLKVDMVSAFGISITYTDNDGD